MNGADQVNSIPIRHHPSIYAEARSFPFWIFMVLPDHVVSIKQSRGRWLVCSIGLFAWLFAWLVCPASAAKK